MFIVLDIYTYNVSYANGIGQNWSSRSSIQIVVQNWHLINLTSWFFFHWWHKFGHIYISKRNLFQKYAKRTWSPCSSFEDPGRFLGSTGDRQLKSLEFAWYKISWNLSKFELIQTTLLSFCTWFLTFSSLKFRVWWTGFFS